MIPCSSPTYSAPAAAACMSDFDPLLILDKKIKSRPAASNKEFPNKQKWRKAERGIKDGIDFGLRTRELRKAMEERTIIGELMIFQKYIDILNLSLLGFHHPSFIS